MSINEIRAKEYLTPPKDWFWKWSEQGDAIVWNQQFLNPNDSHEYSEGATIVFQRELAKIVEAFGPGGAPPLGAILLLIAATRDNWEDVIFSTGGETWQTPPNCVLRNLVPMDMRSVQRLGRLVIALNHINRLDNDVRLSMEAKQTLVDVVLGECQGVISAEVTREVLRLLNSDTEELFVRPTGFRNVARQTISPLEGRVAFRKDMILLLEGLESVDAAVLRNRRATGLDQPIKEPEVELPTLNSASVRSLVKQLQDDSEFCGMARAARQLMSVVSLPRPISQLDTLEQGGVNDITNRGPLDRLLLSELANDDMTLAVRVALNEAMYLRKETPPKIQNRQRLILLDCGIRMWGVPRVFATAMAMAMGAAGHQDIELGIYSAAGDSLSAVNLSSREGLQKQLAVLRHEMHAGQSLPAFAALSKGFVGDVERILITCPEALEDEEFARELLQNSDLFPLYIASMDRSGECRLTEVGEKGRKEIKRVKIDIDQIAPTKSSLIRRDIAKGLPSFYAVHPCPLLFPVSDDRKRVWCGEDQLAFAITNDKRLLVWTDPSRGGLELSQNISKGKLLWGSEQSVGGLYYAITEISVPNRLRLVTVDLASSNASEQVLAIDRGAKGFCAYMGSVFVCYGHGISRINPETGESAETIKSAPGMSWVRDRFFRRGNDWFALAGDSLDFRLEKIPMPSKIAEQADTVFECRNVEGPIVVTERGDLYFTSTEKMINVFDPSGGEPVTCEDIGTGGEMILLRSEPVGRPSIFSLVDVTSGQASKTYRSIRQMELNDRIKERSKRNRFLEAGIRSNGVFYLRTRKGQVLDLAVERGAEIRLKSSPIATEGSVMSTFRDVGSPEGTGFKLSVASFKCGSKIFLDSRGLLHFLSSNERVPEFTFTLSDNRLAGWSSSGEMFGDLYNVGRETGVLASSFYAGTIEPFVKHCLKSC